MTNQNFERTGLQVEVRGLQRFVQDINRSVTLNERLARSQLQLQAVSERAAARRIALEAAVTKAKQRQAVIEEAANQRIAQAQAKVVAAQQVVQQKRNASDVQRAAAQKQLVAVENALVNTRIAQQGRLQAAAIATDAALARQAAGLRTLAIEQQLAFANVTGAAAQLRSGVNTLVASALTPFRLAVVSSRRALTFFGEALIAVTGFANRFAVSMRFGLAALTAFAGAFAITTASSFEDQLAQIDVLTEATSEDVGFLSSRIKELAQVVPKSPNELGAALYFVLSSGVKDLNQALEITETAARASAAGLGTTDQIARILTATINAYGAENISAAQAADVLFAAIQQGSAEPEDFVQNLGRLLGIAPNLGIEFDQLTAAVADLTNVGLPANQATTALLGIMNQLISPSERASEVLSQAGLSIEGLRKSVAEKGLIPTLIDVSDELDDNIQLFEELFPEVRGLSGALNLLRRDGAAFTQTLDAIQNSGGVVDQAFQRMSETFSFQANLLKNQLILFLVELGEGVLPGLITKIGNLVKSLDENRDSIISFVNDGISIASEAISSFATGIATIIGLFRAIVGEKAAVITALGLIGVAFAAAFGGVPLLVAGVITAFGFIIRNIDLVSLAIINFGIEAVNAFRNIGSAIETFLLGPLGLVIDTVGKIGDALGIVEFEGLNLVDNALDEAERVLRDRKAVFEARLATSGSTEVPDGLTAGESDAAALFEQQLAELEARFNDNAVASSNFSDALADGVITYKEAIELGIDAITAGALEASVAFRDADEEAFEFTKTLSKVANAFKKSEDAANDLVLALAREALAKVRAAQQALFGAPTVEVAQLQLDLALLDKRRAEAEAIIIPQLQDAQDRLDELRELQADQERGEAPTDDPIVTEVIQKGLGQDARGAIGEFDESLEEAIETVEDEIAGYERRLELLDREGQAIQRQIALYEADTAILEARLLLADKTLLTQEEQRKKAEELIAKTAEVTSKIVELSDKTGQDVIPAFDEMRNAVDLLTRALGVLEDEDEREGFIRAVDLAGEAASGMADEVKNATDEIADTVETWSERMSRVFDIEFTGLEDFSVNQQPPELQVPKIVQDFLDNNANGALITRPTISTLGEGGHPELVLPLTRPTRARQLIRSVPPSLASGIFGGQSMPSSMFGDLNVQGETLETMRLAARSEVDYAFRQKQSKAYHRAGL